MGGIIFVTRDKISLVGCDIVAIDDGGGGGSVCCQEGWCASYNPFKSFPSS